MYNAVHHYGTGLLSSVLECFPGEALHHGSDAAGVAIVSCHESSRSPLDGFYLLDVIRSVWIPYCGCIFHLSPHKCLVAGVLDFLWAR